MTTPRTGLLTLLASTLLGGCALQAPVRNVSAPPGEGGVLVLTHAVVTDAGRGDFHRASARIASALPDQPGLVGYAVRRTLIGDEAWTLTLWKNESARAAFVASDLHRTAMATQMSALRCARFARLPWQGSAPTWADALHLLDRHARTYDDAHGGSTCTAR